MPSAISTPLKRMASKPNRPSGSAQMKGGKDTPQQAQARDREMDRISNQVNKAGVGSARSALKKMGYGGPR